MLELDKFNRWVDRQDWAGSTKQIYRSAVASYASRHSDIEARTLNAWKAEQYRRYKPAGTNLRIRAMNVFLEYNRCRHRIKCVPAQQVTRLDRVMSVRDYQRLCEYARDHCSPAWRMYIRLAATIGGRPGDTLILTGADIIEGHKDILSKGKWRTIYIPRLVQREYISLFGPEHAGPFLVREDGVPFSQDYVRHQIKVLACKAGLDPSLFYPYAFRHFYAKNFLRKSKDISLLADLLGHKDIKTTMIYARMSLHEQREQINRIVNW